MGQYNRFSVQIIGVLEERITKRVGLVDCADREQVKNTRDFEIRATIV